MIDFLAGVTVMASLAVTLFFLRFWRSTRDRFFLMFAMGFFLDGLTRLFVTSFAMGGDASPSLYLVRLVAHGLILWAVIEKNLPSKRIKNDTDVK